MLRFHTLRLPMQLTASAILLIAAGVSAGDDQVIPVRDYRKAIVENPVKKTVAASSAPAADKNANPRVEPGRVHWHKDYAAACLAARKSGKPVLLFQMLGKLDEQFC